MFQPFSNLGGVHPKPFRFLWSFVLVFLAAIFSGSCVSGPKLYSSSYSPFEGLEVVQYFLCYDRECKYTAPSSVKEEWRSCDHLVTFDGSVVEFSQAVVFQNRLFGLGENHYGRFFAEICKSGSISFVSSVPDVDIWRVGIEKPFEGDPGFTLIVEYGYDAETDQPKQLRLAIEELSEFEPCTPFFSGCLPTVPQQNSIRGESGPVNGE